MASIAKPSQAILVTSRYKGKNNIITLAWHMKTSFYPELFAISVGKKRFSCEMIRNSKCFAANFMSYENKKEVLYCGTYSGRDVDKFKETKLSKEECDTINCCRIKEALAYFECKVVKEIETGDHIIFIGKVSKSKLKKKGKRVFYIERDKFTTTVD